MGIIDAFEYVFPLVGCVPTKNGTKIQQIYGTAFYIKNKNFIVAGHSIKNALRHESIGLLYTGRNDSSFRIRKVTDHEVITDYDIGFVKAEIPEAKATRWDFDELPMSHDIQTVGFPHALDLSNLVIGIRAFKGYIISRRTFYRFPSNPRCYELSFHCPRGLSGAPLFAEQQTEARVKGVVIGNESAEMLVYSGKECIKETKETIVERYETTQFGIAIQTRSLQHVKSTVLGSSLLEYLDSVNLI